MLSKLILLQVSAIEQILAIHQANQKLKITAFDICSSFIAVGSNSGKLYFLNHESLLIMHQLATQNGRIIEISVSPDEGHIAYANNYGHVFITKVPGQASSVSIHPTSSSEHKGSEITVLIWSPNGSELYIGDKNGNLTVLHAPSSFASSFLMNLTHHLMHLESGIVQLDIHDHYLLVSTVTKSYLCNSRLETYSQIGTKPRNGLYGGCFCSVNSQRNLTLICNNANSEINSAIVEMALESNKKITAKYKSFEKIQDCKSVIKPTFGTRKVNLEEGDIFNDSSILNLMSKKDIRIFCSRPGARLWEADLKGKVLATHHLRHALTQSPSLVIELEMDNLSVNDIENSSNLHTIHQLSLKHVIKFYDNYIIATSAIGLHLIDPQHSKIILWTLVDGGVESIKVYSNIILYRTCATGQLNKLIITTADIAILTLHSRELYEKCAALCIKYASLFDSSYLLRQFGKNIIKDLLHQINKKELIQGLDSIRKSLLTSDLCGYRNTPCIKIENSYKGRHCSYAGIDNSQNSDGEYSTPKESSFDSNKANIPSSFVTYSSYSSKNANAVNVVKDNQEKKIEETSEKINLLNYGKSMASPVDVQSIPILMNVTSSWINSLSSSTKAFRNALKESLSFKKTEEFIKKLDSSVVNGFDFISTATEVTTYNKATDPVDMSIAVIPEQQQKKSKKSFSIPNFSSEVELKIIKPKIHDSLFSYQNIVSEILGKVPYCESHAELDSILVIWLSQYINTIKDISDKSLGMNIDDLIDECSIVINFECSSLSDIRKDSTKLFIFCFKRRIIISSEVTNLNWSSQFPQHFLTPEMTKMMDSFYASIIENDLGFLNYSFILDNLTSINANLLYHSWISIMKKVTEDRPIFYKYDVTNIEFSRMHRLQHLKKLLIASKSLCEFLLTASKIVHSTVLYDIFFLFLYFSCSNASLSVVHSNNINLVLNHFLIETSRTQNIQALYLKYWSECPEIQYEIIASLLCHKDSEQNKCFCGFPLPGADCIMTSKILKCIFNLPVYHPVEVSTLCQRKGFFYGFITINLKYNLCACKEMVTIALQTALKANIILLFGYLEEKDYLHLLKSLYELRGSSQTHLKCLNCSSSIEIVNSNNEKKNLSNLLSQNGNDFLSSYSELWDFVLSSLLQYKGSLFAMQLLNDNCNIVPLHGVIKLFLRKLIVCSLVEMVGTNFHLALIKYFMGTPRTAISIKVLISFDNALKRNKDTDVIVSSNNILIYDSSTTTATGNSDFERHTDNLNYESIKSNKLCDNKFKFNENQLMNTFLNETANQPRQVGAGHSRGSLQVISIHPPTKQHPHSNRFCHHWGVRVQILTGICQLCQLGLTVEVMVIAGGLTIFSCGHAYHAVCLHQHGRSCILCFNEIES